MGDPTTQPAPTSSSGVTVAKVETALETALQMTAAFAPLAALGGPSAAAIGALVGQAASTAAAMLPQIEEDAAILSSGDTTKIKALQAQLQAENEALAAQIAALPD